MSVTTAASYSAAHIIMTYDDGLSVPSGLLRFHWSTGFANPVNGAQCPSQNLAYTLKVTMRYSFGDLLLFCFGNLSATSSWGLNSKYHKNNISGG